MDITIYPHKLCGTISAIPSKSHAHRILICAAFADKQTDIICPQTNRDIEATADCLRSLGADILRTSEGYRVIPVSTFPRHALLDCGESGSTLRFMLPVVGALGVNATFKMDGRLPQRPLSPLWEEMERMGCSLSRPTENTVLCTGRLRAGEYSISGSISSQFITGLLFALALIDGASTLKVAGKIESGPYITITQQTLSLFGIDARNMHIHGCRSFSSPGTITVEGDWSNAAFFLAAHTLGNDVSVTGLNPGSAQGDRACTDILSELSAHTAVDAAQIPDLVPILAVVAGAQKGAVFTNIQRLRLKESDRVASVAKMLNVLGADTKITDSTLTVFPGTYGSATIDSASDHRIAMAAAIAATVADGPVTIRNAQCVDKSYPSFWEEYKRLGGIYEQHIR